MIGNLSELFKNVFVKEKTFRIYNYHNQPVDVTSITY